MTAAGQEPLFELEHTYTVGELGRLVQEILTVSFPSDVWVQGEVRNIRRPSSGHVYFDIVDACADPGRPPEAILPVVLFKGTREIVNAQIRRSGNGMRIDDGVAVRVRGLPDFYPPHGRLQLRMTGIDPAYTLGLLTAARDRLLQMLRAEDLLERNRALPFPLAPLRIGLVTAAGSAAHADFVDELARSAIAFEVLLATTPVQGVGAARRVCAAIEACLAHRVDIVAIVRGGGARTDLVVFDDELVARTIAVAGVPVLTGIGHEIDSSVADIVAHTALKTPTACAGLLVERVLEAERRAMIAWGGVVSGAHHAISDHDDRLTGAITSIGHHARAGLRDADHRTRADARRTRELVSTQLARSSHRLSRHAQALSLSTRHRLQVADDGVVGRVDRLRRALPIVVHEQDTALDHAEGRIRLLDPARTLARGWSITTGPDGAVVHHADDLSPGDRLTTRVASGTIVSTVATVEPAGTTGDTGDTGDTVGDDDLPRPDGASPRTTQSRSRRKPT